MYWYNLVLLYMLSSIQSSTHFHAFCIPLSPLFNFSIAFYHFCQQKKKKFQHCYFYLLPQSLFWCWLLSVLSTVCMLQCTPLQTNKLRLYHFVFLLFYFSLFIYYQSQNWVKVRWKLNWCIYVFLSTYCY